MTDDNSLYHMRSRYYSPEIKWFINQDILTGSIGNSASLNLYSYVEGNPVSYTDPFGLSPFDYVSVAIHSVLHLASLIPGIGIGADAVNAFIYLLEGKTTFALFTVLSAVSPERKLKFIAKNGKSLANAVDTIFALCNTDYGAGLKSGMNQLLDDYREFNGLNGISDAEVLINLTADLLLGIKNFDFSSFESSPNPQESTDMIPAMEGGYSQIPDNVNRYDMSGNPEGNHNNRGNNGWRRMTAKESAEAARKLGFEKTNYRSKNGEPVYYNRKTKTYISQDTGSANGLGPHNGGVWKQAKSPRDLDSREKRMGTYDANFNRIGD